MTVGAALTVALPVFVLAWSVAHLVYVYGGYVTVLKALARIRGRIDQAQRTWPHQPYLPTMTIYVGAKDEADIIEDRLANLVDTKYPLDRLELMVVADGCVDDTAAIARQFGATRPELRLRVVEAAGADGGSQGKWYAQNLAASEGWGEILVSTDAETAFEPDTLTELAAPFADPTIGVVGGHVIYLPPGSSLEDGGARDSCQATLSEPLPGDEPTAGTGLSRAYGAYREFEHRIRLGEMANGFLMKSDGPCVAYRRTIWQPIEPYEDVDHVVCYFARFAGLESVYAPEAVAYDRANETRSQDIRQRSRMTRKFFLTQRRRWSFRRWFTDPGFSWAIYSHRTARLLSPLWLTLGIASALWLLAGPVRSAAGWAALAAAALGAICCATLVAQVPRLRGFALSFVTAQVGFGAGLWQFASGNETGRYTPTRRLG